LRRNYAAIDVIGQAKVGNRRAYKVQFTSKQGDLVIRYYDTETFLLMRMDQRQWDPQERGGPEANDLIESDFTDYRDYGGLKLPQLITVNLPPRPLMFKINKAKPNAKITDSVFR
jgi:zinc protease